jgi:hypothetical protein
MSTLTGPEWEDECDAAARVAWRVATSLGRPWDSGGALGEFAAVPVDLVDPEPVRRGWLRRALDRVFG